MEIKALDSKDLDYIVDLWYKVSIEAHKFVKREYWLGQKYNMKAKYLPQAKTYVIKQNKKILGFISMVDNYLAALFVAKENQNQGLGKKLLDYIKENNEFIQLKVFVKNTKAIDFYIRNGFLIKEELLDESTREKEYLMIWEKAQ